MPKIVDKEAKRTAILQAAIEVFAEKGSMKTKIADIASRAGIGKGTVYEYFESKEAIFQEAMNFFLAELAGEIAKGIQGIADPERKLRKVLDIAVAGFIEHIDYLQVTLDFWAVGLRGDQLPYWRHAYDYFIELVSAIFEEGAEQGVFKRTNSRALASGMIGLLDGVMFQLIIYKSSFPMLDVVDTIFDTLMQGLRD